MDVSRGDQVMCGGEVCEVLTETDPIGKVALRRCSDGVLAVVAADWLSPVPPDVVTPPDYSFGEALEYRTSVGPWLPAKWVGVDPVNEGMGVLRNDSNKGANVVTVGLHDIRRPLPDVVTLTLSYRGHEVSEEMDVTRWRHLSGNSPDAGPVTRACRALAEKVDGEDRP